MTREKGNNNSLAEAVRNEVGTMPHIKSSLGDGIVNYSALARKIIPTISEKLQKTPNEESVIVAIKRYSDELNSNVTEPSHLKMFADSEVMLQDGMAYTHFRKTDRINSKVEKLFAKEDWNMGEMRVLIKGADQLMLIAKETRLKELKEEFSEEILHSITNGALVTFRMPFESFNVFGLIAEITSLLAKKGISVELLSSPPDIHFLVDEVNAEKAYATLKKLVKDSKSAIENK